MTQSNKYNLTVADVERCWWVDDTGTVRWKASVEPVPNNCLHLFNGTVAGAVTKVTASGVQYRKVTYTVGGVEYQIPAHVIAYVLYKGRFPLNVVDHIDGNGLNNTENNLRDVGQRINICNAKLQARSKSGVKGVTTVPNREGQWQAYAKVQGKQRHLYQGTDFFEACCARKSFEVHNDADKAYSGRGNLKGG